MYLSLRLLDSFTQSFIYLSISAGVENGERKVIFTCLVTSITSVELQVRLVTLLSKAGQLR